MTQQELSNRTDISIIAYQNYEAGKRIPNAYIAQRLAKALNSSVEELFNDVDNEIA